MKYFGTDGIRSEAVKFTPEFIFKIVAGLSNYAETKNLSRPPKVLIGGDTRESTEWILQDLKQALEFHGFDYASVGVLPTPAINYCFYHMGFDFAIDVTASHNPYTDNGIKIFERGENSGVKLGEQGCEFVETALASGDIIYTESSTTDREDLHNEALELYKNHLLNYLEAIGTSTGTLTTPDFSGLRLGLDCANGAMSTLKGEIFERLGAEVLAVHDDANYGREINHDCGSTHPEDLQALVKSEHLDLGIAYDGDGDRTLLVNENGDLVDGDEIIALLTGFLKLDKIAITVMSNQGLFNWAKENNITAEITAVGDSNVAAAMREKNIPLGGEQSGHIILPGEPTGDGMLTSLMVVKAVSETRKSPKELASVIEKLPQVAITMPASSEQKEALTSSDATKAIIAQFEEKVKAEVDGRLLVRPSGTEPKVRITLWGGDETEIASLAEEIKQALETALN